MVPRAPSITFVSYSFREGIGGVETCSRLVARVLARNASTLGYQCNFVATRDSESEIIEGRPTIATGSSTVTLLRVLMMSGQGSLVIFGHINLARAALLVPWIAPLATFLHGIEVWQRPGMLHRLALGRSQHLVAVSEFTRSNATGSWNSYERADVCLLGTQENAPPDDGTPLVKSPPTALMVGRLVPGRDKGHRSVLDVWAAVRRRVPDAELAIVGGGPDLEGIRRHAAGIAGVSILGRVPEKRLHELWRSARLLVLPSLGEGFGIVYVDAMRRGIPVIVSDRDAGREVVGCDGAGHIVDPSDPRQLVDSLVHLLDDDDEYERRSDVARKRWQRMFSFGAFEDRFIRLLSSWLPTTPEGAVRG